MQLDLNVICGCKCQCMAVLIWLFKLGKFFLSRISQYSQTLTFSKPIINIKHAYFSDIALLFYISFSQTILKIRFKICLSIY